MDTGVGVGGTFIRKKELHDGAIELCTSGLYPMYVTTTERNCEPAAPPKWPYYLDNTYRRSPKEYAKS